MKTLLLRSAPLFFFFLLHLSATRAQDSNSRFIAHYTNENGLPQNTVRYVVMDWKGYLWLATNAGLVRFDGTHFKVYNSRRFPTMTSDWVLRLRTTDWKAVYFGVAYDTATYAPGAGDQPVKLWNNYTPPGNNFGIVEMDRLIGCLFPSHAPPYRGVEGMCRAMPSIYFNGKDGRRIWTDSLFMIEKSLNDRLALVNNCYYYYDKQKRLSRIDSNRNIIPIRLSGDALEEPAGTAIDHESIFLNQGSSMYLHLGNGIFAIEPVAPDVLHTRKLLDVTGIPDIACFARYPELGLDVVGSHTTGLYLFRHNPFRTISSPSPINKSFYAHLPWGPSGVFSNFGTSGQPVPGREKLPIYFKSMLLDRNGHYWVNLQKNTPREYAAYVAELDSQLNILKQYPLKKKSNVISFSQAPDKTIWFVTIRNFIGKISGDSLHWLCQLPFRQPCVPHVMMPVNDSLLLLGGNDLLMLMNTRTLQHARAPAFANKEVRTLYRDREDILWIGTYGSGYYAFERGMLHRMPLDPEGALNDAHCFLEDKNGSLWITTNKGLFRFRAADLRACARNGGRSVYYQYFDRNDGLTVTEFNGGCTPSGVQLNDGRLSFPSINALVQFHPDSVPVLPPVSGIYIDEVLVDGHRRKETIREVPPSFNRIEFRISSPYFGNPANQRIEYNIKGQNNSWYPVGNDNSIVLNTLPYGSYELRLRKRSGPGEKTVTTQYAFTVQPFFYQRWHFKALMALLVLAAVTTFFRLRYSWLLRQKGRLEREVQDRTRELLHSNRMKEKLTLVIAHDLQSPLHFMSMLSNKLYRIIPESDNPQMRNISHELKNTSEQISLFMEEFHLWASTFNENFHLNKIAFPLTTLLQELQLFFKEMLAAKGNTLQVHLESEALVFSDRSMLKIILRNLIDNANKHTENGNIHVRFLEKAGKGVVMVSDTGEGMDEQSFQRIQARIAQGAGPSSVEKSHRLGYQIIIDFVWRLGGSLSMKSTPGEGTTVVISNLDVSPAAVTAETRAQRQLL